MNRLQQLILKGALVVAVLMLLYPPKHFGIVPLQRQYSENDPGAGLVLQHQFILGLRLGHTSNTSVFSLGIAWEHLRLQYQWLLVITLLLLVIYRSRGDSGGERTSPSITAL